MGWEEFIHQMCVFFVDTLKTKCLYFKINAKTFTF